MSVGGERECSLNGGRLKVGGEAMGSHQVSVLHFVASKCTIVNKFLIIPTFFLMFA